MMQAWNIYDRRGYNKFGDARTGSFEINQAMEKDWLKPDYDIRVWRISKRSFGWRVRGNWLNFFGRRRTGKATTFDAAVQMAIRNWKGDV